MYSGQGSPCKNSYKIVINLQCRNNNNSNNNNNNNNNSNARGHQETTVLFQRLSMALQRAVAVSFQNTMITLFMTAE